MSSQWKGIALGVMAGLVLAGLFSPWHVVLAGWFRLPATDGTPVSWTLSIEMRPPLSPFPFRIFFGSHRKPVRRRRQRKKVPSVERGPGKGGAFGGIREFMDRLLPALRHLLSRFEVTEARARIEVGTGDGAWTALVAGGLVSFFRGVLRLFVPAPARRLLRNVTVVPAYDRTGIEGTFRMAGRLRPVYLVSAGTRFMLALAKEKGRFRKGLRRDYAGGAGAR